MAAMKVFVPFTEELFARLGAAPGDLVPFQLEYEIFHAQELTVRHTEPVLHEPTSNQPVLHQLA